MQKAFIVLLFVLCAYGLLREVPRYEYTRTYRGDGVTELRKDRLTGEHQWLHPEQGWVALGQAGKAPDGASTYRNAWGQEVAAR